MVFEAKYFRCDKGLLCVNESDLIKYLLTHLDSSAAGLVLDVVGGADLGVGLPLQLLNLDGLVTAT